MGHVQCVHVYMSWIPNRIILNIYCENLLTINNNVINIMNKRHIYCIHTQVVP